MKKLDLLNAILAVAILLFTISWVDPRDGSSVVEEFMTIVGRQPKEGAVILLLAIALGTAIAYTGKRVGRFFSQAFKWHCHSPVLSVVISAGLAVLLGIVAGNFLLVTSAI